MIPTMSVHRDLKREPCPEENTKSRAPPRAMLFLVKSGGFSNLHPRKITKSYIPGRGVGTLVIILGYTLYQLNSYKGGS